MDVSKLPYHHPRPWDAPIETTTMPALFGRAVDSHPDRTLVEFLGRKLSYQAMHAEARRFAAGLQQAGIGRGDRVGLFLPNVPIYLSAYYGAMMAGATVVNFSPLYSVDELSHQVEDSGTRLLVTVDVAQLYDTAAQVLEASSLETLVVGELAGMLPIVKRLGLKLFKRSAVARPAYGVRNGKGISTWRAMLPRTEPRHLDITPDEIALLQYTGGTTGRPKGAMLSHRNVVLNAAMTAAMNMRVADDVQLTALPCAHVYGAAIMNLCMLLGSTFVLMERFDAGEMMDAVQIHKATITDGVPTMYFYMLAHPEFDKFDLSSITRAVVGGQTMPEVPTTKHTSAAIAPSAARSMIPGQ